MLNRTHSVDNHLKTPQTAEKQQHIGVKRRERLLQLLNSFVVEGEVEDEECFARGAGDVEFGGADHSEGAVSVEFKVVVVGEDLDSVCGGEDRAEASSQDDG
jgi:hypothetical protein